MKILFWGLVVFLLAIFIHLIIWRIRIPKGQIKSLLFIYFGVLLVSFIILGKVTHLTLVEYLHISLFFTSISLAYIATYSAIEVDSPTLLMINNIAKAGNKGLSKEELLQILNDDILVKPRIRDLIDDKMIYLDNDKYKLTTRGDFLTRIFIFYRKLLNAGKGG